MRFTAGAVGHKSTQGATRTFSQDSYELGDDREDETGIKQNVPGDPTVQTELGDHGVEVAAGDFTLNDDNELEDVVADEEGEAEIEYGYRMLDEEDWEDEPEDEIDTDGEGGDLGPEDGEEGWEDDVFELEGYAAL
jgi:hypothetical protein